MRRLSLLKHQNQENMELAKFIHDLAIIGGFIAIAILPRVVVALVEAKANGQKQAEERI